jgi:hypothetical protein
MRAFVPLLAILALPLAESPAHADVYKWVDDAGTMHYSDAPPPDRRNKAKVIAQDRLSTYQSDPNTLRSLAQTAAQLHQENLDRKVERLERELASQRSATQYAGGYGEQCYVEGWGWTNCDSGYAGPYYPYAAAYYPAAARGKIARQIHRGLHPMPVAQVSFSPERKPSRGLPGR